MAAGKIWLDKWGELGSTCVYLCRRQTELIEQYEDRNMWSLEKKGWQERYLVVLKENSIVKHIIYVYIEIFVTCFVILVLIYWLVCR